MNEHIGEERLNDYLGDALTLPQRAAVEAHLAGCATCARMVEAQRRLLVRLHGLPASIQPPPALRAAVLEGLPAPARAPAREWRRALRTLRYPLAAAAVLLVVATAVVTRWTEQRGSTAHGRVAVAPATEPGRPQAGASAGTTAPAPPEQASSTTTAGTGEVPAGSARAPMAGPAKGATGASRMADDSPAAMGVRAPAVLPAAVRRDEARFTGEIEELQRQLEQQRDRLSPATVRILERNLRAIDRAIAESRTALARDPGSRALRSLMLSAYGQKLDLLRRAASFSS